MNIEEVLKKNILKYGPKNSHFLLGLSGGSDSMALFHLLLRLKNEKILNFSVAHVNHNWRKESEEEACFLKEMVKSQGISFHLMSLDPKTLKGNLELACRLERLKFFKKLCFDFSCQGVILGHHYDDQAETVLKRILEGASLCCLTGLKEIKTIEGLTIFRPLLEVRKSEIQSWLLAAKISYFEDSTNLDPKYMRGKFRTKILPFLSQEFGKEVTKPLHRLGFEANELNEYLEQKFEEDLKKIVKGKCGSYYDFSKMNLAFEVKYLIKQVAKLEGVLLTRPLIEAGCQLIQSNAANKMMKIAGKMIYFDRKKMFVLSDSFHQVVTNQVYPVDLELDTRFCGTLKVGEFHITLEEEFDDERSLTSWENVFKGSVEVLIPAGRYRLKSASNEMTYRNRLTIKKLWETCKVPLFLRRFMPVLVKNEEVYQEFLTSQNNQNEKSECKHFKLKIGLMF